MIWGIIYFIQKNPRAHKHKIGTSPQKNPKYPPVKRGIFMDMEVFLQKEGKIPGAHKIGAPISSPRIADKTFFGHEDFSDLCSCSCGDLQN